MKRTIILLATVLFGISAAKAEDVDLRELDTESRVSQPNTNSIMFPQNAEQYKIYVR